MLVWCVGQINFHDEKCLAPGLGLPFGEAPSPVAGVQWFVPVLSQQAAAGGVSSLHAGCPIYGSHFAPVALSAPGTIVTAIVG